MILYIYPKFLGDVASLNGKIRIQKTLNKGETAFDCNGAGNSLCEQHFSPEFIWFEVRCLWTTLGCVLLPGAMGKDSISKVRVNSFTKCMALSADYLGVPTGLVRLLDQHSKVRKVPKYPFPDLIPYFWFAYYSWATPFSHKCIYISQALTSYEKWLLAYELSLNTSSQLFVICGVQLVCLITWFCLFVPSTDGWAHLNQENNEAEK